jgi:hypothetical protein
MYRQLVVTEIQILLPLQDGRWSKSHHTGHWSFDRVDGMSDLDRIRMPARFKLCFLEARKSIYSIYTIKK